MHVLRLIPTEAVHLTLADLVEEEQEDGGGTDSLAPGGSPAGASKIASAIVRGEKVRLEATQTLRKLATPTVMKVTWEVSLDWMTKTLIFIPKITKISPIPMKVHDSGLEKKIKN